MSSAEEEEFEPTTAVARMKKKGAAKAKEMSPPPFQPDLSSIPRFQPAEASGSNAHGSRQSLGTKETLKVIEKSVARLMQEREVIKMMQRHCININNQLVNRNYVH